MPHCGNPGRGEFSGHCFKNHTNKRRFTTECLNKFLNRLASVKFRGTHCVRMKEKGNVNLNFGCSKILEILEIFDQLTII